jgi:glycine cleavage system protein P-like pyridoxal-binding family
MKEMNEAMSKPTETKPTTDYDKLREGLKRIQTTIKAAKTKYNSFAKYYYRSLEDILAAVKPYLNSMRMTMIFENEIKVDSGIPYVNATVTLTYGTASISASAQAIIDMHGKGKSPEQATGSAITYARKYAIAGLLLLDDGDGDPDACDNRGYNNNNNNGKNRNNGNGYGNGYGNNGNGYNGNGYNR